MRRLILNMHLAIGLVAGIFVTLLGATGGILAFEPELDRLLHRNLSYVKPGGRTLSLVELGNAIAQTYPGEGIVAYLPSTAPDLPTRVILSRGIVSLNQYTGVILGVLPRGESFLSMVRALHVRLAMGDIGRGVLKWSSFATLLSLISGLYLWWPVKRMRIGGARWSARFWYDLHSSVGFYSLLPALILAASGVILGFEDQAARLLDRVTGSRAVVQNHDTPTPKSDRDGSQITPDQAVLIAGAQLPSAVPYRVQMPRYGGFYVVALNNPRYRITGKRNLFSLDPSSGRIVSAHLSSDLTFGESFLAANSKVHDGSIWGMPSKVVAALASILLPLQAISGLLIWLRRKGILRTRQARS